MAVDRGPERDGPGLALDRRCGRRHRRHRGGGSGQRVARGDAGGIRRGREAAGQRDNHHFRSFGGGDEVAVGADGRGKRVGAALEGHSRQCGRAVDQDQAAALAPGSERRPAESIEGICEPGHDVRQGVARHRGVAGLRYYAADIDAHRPDLARHRRCGCQRGADDVGLRVHVGGQARGENFRRFDLVGIGMGGRGRVADDDGHGPCLVDMRNAGQGEARGGARHGLGDAAGGR